MEALDHLVGGAIAREVARTAISGARPVDVGAIGGLGRRIGCWRLGRRRRSCRAGLRSRYLARENDYQAAAQQAQLIQDLYETKNELVPARRLGPR